MNLRTPIVVTFSLILVLLFSLSVKVLILSSTPEFSNDGISKIIFYDDKSRTNTSGPPNSHSILHDLGLDGFNFTFIQQFQNPNSIDHLTIAQDLDDASIDGFLDDGGVGDDASQVLVDPIEYPSSYDPIPDESFEGNIFLDFLTLDTSLFSFPSYASMDSLLHIYPNASYSVVYTASGRIRMYRLGNMLSYHQFDKYEKRGYKIDKEVVDVTRYKIAGPGKGWWSLHSKEFPPKTFNDREGDKTLSFIQATYFRCLLILFGYFSN